jgi:hypothetical protein
MAPQQNGWQKEERSPPPWVTQDGFDPTIVTTAISSSQVPVVPAQSSERASMAFQTQSAGDDSTQTRHRPSTRPDGYPSTLPWPPYPLGAPTATSSSSETSTSPTGAVTGTPYPEAETTFLSSITDASPGPLTEAPFPSTVGPYGGRPSGWDWSKKDHNKASMYAVAAVVPILILAAILAVTLVCLRRRKNHRAEAAMQEMKMEPHTSEVQPHMAPSTSPVPAVSISQHYATPPPPTHLPPTSTSSQFQPIILGPIGSSVNGAYLTGMDTSDMVSITSNTHISMDPFSDNHSVMGPPPPYRPSSAPPPSFTTNSRQSSIRVPVSPVCLRDMARSPFDDPDPDMDDGVSVLSDLEVHQDFVARAY